ncbi:sugar ABC transporter substrate-binding protein [Clostridium sp. JN-1]|uniref:sugar ABC transporter substrate-binding protein n=1 Tax=Clostridium sp. JN-1 TaxID=2483110 RepID=UPI000F0BA1CC|nr:sugar ABC transporter substrate-binding protein [Clostridium sp. JN-1]
MKKRNLIIVSILTLSIFMTACGKSNVQEAKKSSKSSEITFMIPEWGVPSNDMLNEFTKETGIKVNVDTVSWDDIRNKVSVAANGKKAAADVMEVDWSWIGEFSSAGWLEPVNLAKEDVNDIPSISSFTVGGKVLAVPYANDFRIGYYNTDIYQKAGLTEPKTWDEVAEQMKVIKDKGLLKNPYTLPLTAGEGTATSLIWMTYLRDGKVFNDDNTLNKENVMKSLQFTDNMIKKGLINPVNTTSKDIDTYRELTNGEAAFMVGPTNFVSRVNDAKQSKVVGKIMPILPPGGTGKAAQTMALVEGIGVNKYSQNKEAAEIFVKWYTSKTSQAKLYDTNSSIPTRTSVLKDLIDSGKMKNTGAMLETSKLIKSPFPNGVPKYYSEMSSAIYNAVNKMALGQLTPEQAFDEMNAKITKLAK